MDVFTQYVRKIVLKTAIANMVMVQTLRLNSINLTYTESVFK
jgi:hypothetical protein